MSAQPPGSPPDDERPADPDATREVPRPVRSPGPPVQDYGQPPAAYLPPTAPSQPIFPPDYGAPPSPEPRFAGQPYTAAGPPADYAPPGAPYGPYGAPDGSGNGRYGQPWQSPDAAFPPPIAGGWPPAPPAGGPRRRGIWALVTLLIVALVATLTTVLLTRSDSKSTAGAQQQPAAPSGAPSTAPTPSPTPSNPASPLPSLGLVPTPPGLNAIGYHAYSSELVAPADVALGAAEIAEFRRYGLDRIVGLRALTLARKGRVSDDYDASINILRFRDAAGAKAELAYSNTQNKKTSQVVALPGLPAATGFVNREGSSGGVSVGAFITVGRYQVVVILSGLLANRPTIATVVAAETARVMRAVLPDAADIQPAPFSGGGSGVPTLPTPSPSGTRA